MNSISPAMGMERGGAPRAGAVAIGFGTAVGMWGVGYVGRLPALQLPSPLLLALLLACLLGGGVAAGRLTAGGWRAGAGAGLVAGLLNLLVLGSLLSGERPNELVPSALLWVPGSILVSAALAALGAALGGAAPRERAAPYWPAAFVRVAIAATMLLLAVGGLVTSKEAGLAVVDWPNSYGYNMFLYPLSRMTGGVYYEHAHRLFGALVGLTTLVLALWLQRVEPRAWVRRLGWLALAMVVVQGILGGLRVTGRFTLSTSADDMAPSLGLAVVHGVLAQLFFGTLVALGAFTSETWRSGRPPVSRRGVQTDRVLSAVLVALLVAQLVLGAIQRHAQALLMVHIAMAAVVAPLAVNVGVRTWGLNPGEPLLRRLGLGLVALVGLQLALGVGALVLTGGIGSAVSPAAGVVVTTAHQWCGALLLGAAVLILCFDRRLLAEA